MKDLVKIRFENDFDINTEYVAIPEEVYKNYQVAIKQYEALNTAVYTTPRSRIKVYADYVIEDLVPRYEKEYPELFAEWLGNRNKNSLTITDCVEFEFYIGYKNI